MKIYNDLALLVILSATFVMEGSEDEESLDRLRAIFIREGIDVDTFELSGVNTEKEFVDWLEKTISKFQVNIDASEREDDL